MEASRRVADLLREAPRALREALEAHGATLPNVLKGLGTGAADDCLALARELLPGETPDAWDEAGERLRVLMEAARPEAVAHPSGTTLNFADSRIFLTTVP